MTISKKLFRLMVILSFCTDANAMPLSAGDVITSDLDESPFDNNNEPLVVQAPHTLIYSPELVEKLDRQSSPQPKSQLNNSPNTSGFSVSKQETVVGQSVIEVSIVNNENSSKVIKNISSNFIFHTKDASVESISSLAEENLEQVRYQQVERIRRAMMQER